MIGIVYINLVAGHLQYFMPEQDFQQVNAPQNLCVDRNLRQEQPSVLHIVHCEI